MGQGKFAQITSALLSRKGDAAPSLVAGLDFIPQRSPEMARPMTLAEILGVGPEDAPPAPERPKAETPKPEARPAMSKAGISKDWHVEPQPHRDMAGRDMVENISLFAQPASQVKRRIVLTLSASDYERLGIAAVKLHSTPHDLALAALFEHLEAFARDYGGACHCMQTGGACDCKASDA